MEEFKRQKATTRLQNSREPRNSKREGSKIEDVNRFCGNILKNLNPKWDNLKETLGMQEAALRDSKLKSIACKCAAL